MDRKAQTEVMVAALGMVFGLMLAPIPNLASEFVLSGILDQMDWHASRQDAGIDAVRITSEWGPQYKNFNPDTGRIKQNTRDSGGVPCLSSLVPGGNRTVKFGKDLEFASSQCNLAGQGQPTGNEIGRPPEISFMIRDPENLVISDYPNPANSILLNTGVEPN
ncbi:hypothetical protein GLU64_00680 [Nanohaloarchaea archaeon]|nr:hypothetical protein [Candidatus Nanohaloarchaea archaeon]